MKIVCEQPRFLGVQARLAHEMREWKVEGDLFLLGIVNPIDVTMGNEILQFKDSVKNCTGIALYFNADRFKAEAACELPDNLKFFIDGVEVNLGRNVLIAGCPVNRANTEEHWILNRGRWPEREAENIGETISIANEQTEEHT